MSNEHASPSPVSRTSNVVPLVPMQKSRSVLAGLAITLLVLSLAATGAFRSDTAGSGRGTAPQTAADPSSAATGFVYFPGQYVNQATETLAHIQAF